MHTKIIHQFRKILPLLAKWYISTFLFLCITVFLSIGKYYHFPFTRDPAANINIQPLIGFISDIGILFWCIAAAFCFFTAVLLKKIENSRNRFIFFLSSCLITAMLLLDDFLCLHENIFPALFNIHKKTIYLIYAMIIFLFLIRFRDQILKTDFLILFFSFGFFAISLIIDNIPGMVSNREIFIEDGAKLFGIVSWFVYFTRISFQALLDILVCNDSIEQKNPS